MRRRIDRTISLAAAIAALLTLRPVPSAAQYCALPTTNEWFDISGMGGNLGLGNDAAIMCMWPLTFTLYGTAYDNIVISSNGYAFLTNAGFNPGCSFAPPPGGTNPNNVGLPNVSAPGALIAPFWDDLDPSLSGGVHSVGWALAGQPQRLVVQWDGVPHAGGGGTGKFQMQLEDVTHDILFCYQDVDFGNPAYDFGASATVGIQDATGTQALQYSLNSASLTNNSCIRIYASCPCTDADGDGYGNPASPACTYAQLDCNDANPAVNPGATEVLFNGIDDDCNAATPVNPACMSVAASEGPAQPAAASAAATGLGVVLPLAVLRWQRRRRSRATA
ncbi:MAG: putative metal-binding motif-containing protein [bacterium]